VTSLFHVGVAVSDLTESIRIFEKCFGFEMVSRRTVDNDYIGVLVGAPNVTADIAMLDIGDGKFLELISWEKGPSTVLKLNVSSLTDVRTHHICVYVDDADEVFEKLAGFQEVRLISERPITVPIGPNAGCKVFFALVLGEIFIEVFERVLN
jgi:catechol 2,3-dioxygenase-like lactoylglutathione lyase family enzyme